MKRWPLTWCDANARGNHPPPGPGAAWSASRRTNDLMRACSVCKGAGVGSCVQCRPTSLSRVACRRLSFRHLARSWQRHHHHPHPRHPAPTQPKLVRMGVLAAVSRHQDLRLFPCSDGCHRALRFGSVEGHRTFVVAAQPVAVWKEGDFGRRQRIEHAEVVSGAL